MTSSQSPTHKGGVAQAEWVDRFGAIFQRLGWTPYQAECEAVAAWEDADEDVGPNEAANTAISYMREDSE